MHILQPKHSKLKKEEVEKLLKKFNIALSQLPKISMKDFQIAEESELNKLNKGDVLKFERSNEGEVQEYFRVVI